MGIIEEPFGLRGRVAVVCGGARGIGRGAAELFARAGAKIVLADLDQPALKEASAAIDAVVPGTLAVPTDVSVKAEVDALAAQVVETHGRIDVWANVAGILRYGPIVETTEEDLDRIIAINLKGVYWGSAAAARVMTPAGRGSIFNIASAGGEMPAPGISCYALTKAAVLMFTRTLAAEVGPAGVRANSVAPGFVETPMTAVHFTNEDGTIDPDRRRGILDARAGQTPLRLTGEPEDIAYAMLYLASDASRFMTGQTLRPNGGVHMA
jgi:3-oxoacyl-[acyl-carrier protein] reductase